MAGKTQTKQAPQRATTTAATRVERVTAKRREAKPSIKRTIKRKAPTETSTRIKRVKPTAEHPLPEPVATFTW